MANDECTVLSAAFPDGETITLSAGELKRLKRIAEDIAPAARGKKDHEDAEPRRRGRR